MGDQNERQTMALALLDYVRSRQKLAAVTRRVAELAEALENLARNLKQNPLSTSAESYSGVLDYMRLTELIADLRAASEEANRTRAEAERLGVAVEFIAEAPRLKKSPPSFDNP